MKMQKGELNNNDSVVEHVETEREKEDQAFEKIKSEEVDSDEERPTYEILTYPADFTLEVLVDKFQTGKIEVPPYQRGFVWNQVKASRLIESFLLGLPVPPIYLYQDPVENSLLVIDGQQRLKSVTYFFEGYFGEEARGKRPVFRLKGLNKESVYYNKTYEDLENEDPASHNKLNDSTLRAFIIKQLNPDDSTSVFHIFERLNTGASLLKGQEIRNCVYRGGFNDLLIELNKGEDWRKIFGRADYQKHRRDVELILRFFVLYYNISIYQRPMKDFLSDFMKKHRNPSSKRIEEFRRVFSQTASAVFEELGERPFHVRTGLNAAAYDAVFVAFAKNLDRIPIDVKERYRSLLKKPAFNTYISSNTTDKEVILGRLKVAVDNLFG